MTTVIKCEKLSKQFRLGLAPSFDRVTEILQHSVTGMFRRMSGQQQASGSNSFWALRDVDFEVKEGEVVGIIGRNGAGKSTLLKILSRITRPTSGRIRTRGRIASLLEVGAGFHPELTGRENIYLNGSILGMTRREIDSKFDRIIDFAEVEKFLDTPVKRYSSGMYTRLAFSVAAFLEPEILIVDEVLAVGDAEFQQKCLAKMDSVAKSGRTVLFVSHNLKAVRSLCPRGLLLRQGQLVCDDSVDTCLTTYRSFAIDQSIQTETEWKAESSGYRHLSARLLNHQNGALPFDAPIDFEIRWETAVRSEALKIQFRLRDVYGNLILHGDNGTMNRSRQELRAAGKDFAEREVEPLEFSDNEAGQRHTLRCQLGRVPLLPGRYSLEIQLLDSEVSSLNARLELTFEAEASAEAQMADTLASDLSSLYWPAKFVRG